MTDAAPPDAPAAGRPRKIYVSHPPATWERARARYEAGRTAGQVAAELGVSISAVRLQASRGGWTRRDLRARERAGDGAGAEGAADGGASSPAGAAAKAPAAGAGAAPSAAPTALGEGRFDPAPLSLAGAEAGIGAGVGEGRPAHLRLSPQAWEVLRGERLAGASIAKLARKWKVAEGTIRRHARDEGWSNTDRGAALSRAMVEAAIAERGFAEGVAASEREAAEREAAARAAAAGAPEPEADPLEAARLLLRRAAGAAEAGRLEEAAARVKLAEGLARAARALGLDPGEGWPEDEEEEPEETDPEGLQALREELKRKCAEWDARKAAAAAPAPPPAVEAPAGPGAGEDEAEAAPRGTPPPAPSSPPAPPVRPWRPPHWAEAMGEARPLWPSLRSW